MPTIQSQHSIWITTPWVIQLDHAVLTLRLPITSKTNPYLELLVMQNFLKLAAIGLVACLVFVAETNQLSGQQKSVGKASILPKGDRVAVLETVKNFYVGDQTGSIEHKKLSMHKDGAYRYVNRDGKYVESKFDLESDHADPSYKEEILGIEVYENVALARVRLEKIKKTENSKIEYKLMTLHKAKQGWRVTGISWGFGVTH